MSRDNYTGPRESASLGDAGYEAPSNIGASVKEGWNQATSAATNFLHSATSGSSHPSQTEGKTDSLLGNVKESFGKATGDSSLQGAGQGQRAAGSAQEEAATLTGYVKDQVNAAGTYLSNAANNISSGSGNYVSSGASTIDAGIDKTVGDVRARVGDALGAEGVKGAGQAQYARGEAQDVAAKIREEFGSVADQMQGRDPAQPGGRPDPWRAE